MTDIHTYQLSTAENELGVVIAHGEAGINFILSFYFYYRPKLHITHFFKNCLLE